MYHKCDHTQPTCRNLVFRGEPLARFRFVDRGVDRLDQTVGRARQPVPTLGWYWETGTLPVVAHRADNVVLDSVDFA